LELSWTVVPTTRFKQGYKEKIPKLREKVDDAIKLIVASKDPRCFGSRKYGTLNKCYAYDIDFRSRMLFAVDLVKKEIYLLRVCSHKEVYGSS